MKGKQAVITGATAGIGKEIAAQLAAQGVNLTLGCRNMERGRQVAGEISERAGGKEPEVLFLDTSSRQSISDFAGEYKSRHPRLDVLVNNAGLNRQKRQLSVGGIEMTFATNVLGYYLVTAGLLDLLESSAPSRIVNIASTFAGHLDLDDLQYERRPYDGTEAYAQSKACDRLLTWKLARQLRGTGVTANAVAPGLVPDTELYREVPAHVRKWLKQRGGSTAAEGADTAVWLATSPEVQDVTGKFFEEREEVECEFRNREAEEKLWLICEKLTGVRM